MKSSKTYALATLGCKVNQYEGDRLKAQLRGLKNVSFGEPADLYIINTCSITAEAEAKARQLIGRARRAAPAALIVLTGCWDSDKTGRFKSAGADLLLDNTAKSDILNNLPTDFQDVPDIAAELVATERTRTRVFIKIQDGCDAFCSYCAVPHFRGKPASRAPRPIIAEIDALVKAGVREVVLAGIHLGKYGADFDDESRHLENLIRSILKETDLSRLRLSSIEPQEVTDNLINLLAGEPRLARHLHIPLQSGSDSVLTAMNRRYTSAEFISLIDMIRARIPIIGITTDIIVGFPGETDEDFLKTLEVAAAASFSRLHVFKYSPRPKTAAADFPDQVNPIIVKDRANRAGKLGRKLAADFAAGFVGKNIDVLIERKKNGTDIGLTSEYVRVQFERAVNKPGSLIEATGIRAEGDLLIAEKRDRADEGRAE